MDPSVPLTLPNLVDPIAKLAAVGTAITVLTEVCKTYVPEDRVAPPVIAALIAALFTGAWELSLSVTLAPADALSVLLLWFALFQVSVAVYHSTKLAQRRKASHQQVTQVVTDTAVIVPPAVQPEPSL